MSMSRDWRAVSSVRGVGADTPQEKSAKAGNRSVKGCGEPRKV